jgi:anti-anti-sigma regulatory factor
LGTTTGMTHGSREPAFTIRVQRGETVSLAAVGGVVDRTVAPVLTAVLRDLLDDSSLVVVDLASTTLLDAYSVGALVTTHRIAVKHGRELRLQEARGRVLRVLESPAWRSSSIHR